MALCALLAVAPTAGAAGAAGGPPHARADAVLVTADQVTKVGPPTGAGYALPVPGAGALTGRSRAELLDQGIVLHEFVDPGPAWGAGHRGVDLSLPASSDVLAPRAGTVTFAGVVVDRPLMVITHPDGLRSTLEPVAAGHAVGARVEAGAVVGVLAPEASTHCAPAHCLHWGVRRGEEYLDPLLLLGVVEAVVLLPREQRRRAPRGATRRRTALPGPDGGQ
ncbi:M23 family metallopeptidase [Sanguibacter suarezii]|uniref:M23 family metallopeptidase n=1 Tax=Sanguibacter suarezii TaxID=60921 RepID=UPI0008351547|nr:M23 family metallopeptidase [Sanguibacter suarezii]